MQHSNTAADTATQPQTAFVEQFGGTCQNVCETEHTGDEAEAYAKNFTRGGKLIAIPGRFIWEMGKVVGIEKANGERMYKNEEGFYHCEDLKEFASN